MTGGEGGPTPTTELYNPSTGTWSYAGNLIGARSAHRGTLLLDGTVLISAGYNEQNRGSVGDSPDVDHRALSTSEIGGRPRR